MADYLRFESIIQEIANHPLTEYISKNSLNLINYDAFWEIKERHLYIYKVNDRMEELALHSIFGTTENEILCDWFDGEIEIPALNFDNNYFDTILSLSLSRGYIYSHKFILRKKSDPILIESGRYNGYKLSELIKTRFVRNELLIQDYLRSFLSYLFDYNYSTQIITPDFKFSKEEKNFLKKARRGYLFRYYVTERYIHLDIVDNVYRTFDERKELFSTAFKIITKVLSSQFSSTKLLFRNRHFDAITPRSTAFLNPDISFVEKYANELLNINSPDNVEVSGIWEPALIHPDTFNADLFTILQFKFNIIKFNLIEYHPVFLWYDQPPFSEKFILPFVQLFEENYSVEYDTHRREYVHSNTSHYIIGKYLIDVENLYPGFKRKESGENFYDPSMDGSYNSDYEKYNGVYGFNDDTIDNALEGDPENYWNID